MKTINLAPLKSNDVEYEKVTSAAAENYKGDWDDQIHDSFLRYVKQIQEQSQKVHMIRCKAETLGKEAEGLKIDDMRRRADSLCREADSV